LISFSGIERFILGEHLEEHGGVGNHWNSGPLTLVFRPSVQSTYFIERRQYPMKSTEYRVSTSVSAEIKRLMRDIETHRAQTSDFYEELRKHASFLKVFGEGDGNEAKKALERINVLVNELRDQYWDLNEALMTLEGVEFLESDLPQLGAQLSREIIQILKQIGPALHNAHKSLHSNTFSGMTEIYSVVNNKKFSHLDDVLKQLSTAIDRQAIRKLDHLRQKRII
jgi:hypothetical protein